MPKIIKFLNEDGSIWEYEDDFVMPEKLKDDAETVAEEQHIEERKEEREYQGPRDPDTIKPQRAAAAALRDVPRKRPKKVKFWQPDGSILEVDDNFVESDEQMDVEDQHIKDIQEQRDGDHEQLIPNFLGADE